MIRKQIIWEDCICGNKYFHSQKCKSNHRRNYLNERQKKIRIEKRKKGLCIMPGCDCKGETEIVIHQYCKDHRDKLRLKRKW